MQLATINRAVTPYVESGKKSHVIITFNKTKHRITKSQYDKIARLSLNTKIEIDGEIVNTSSIAEIISIEKYKEEKKTFYNYTFNDYKSDRPVVLPRDRALERAINRTSVMIKLFKERYSGEMPKGAKTILVSMEKVLEKHKKEAEKYAHSL